MLERPRDFEPERKHVHTSISRSGEMYPYVKALASEQRLQMLEMLGRRSMYVNEIADGEENDLCLRVVDAPISSAKGAYPPA